MSAFDSNPARSISEKPLTEEAPTAGTPSQIVLEQERIQLQKEAVEREAAIKKWAVQRIRDNYDDFERLMTAKLGEIQA